MSFLDDLNTAQREAAETLAGPLLIVAGAGSGKTRALTYRIANLIAEKKALPWQILAVTFTNKAAGEMERRVGEILEQNFEGLSAKNKPMIGTFHSVCLSILRRNAEKSGRQKGFVIYDTTDTKSLMNRIIREQRMDDQAMKPPVVLGVISTAKHQLLSADDFAARASNYFERQVAGLYHLYEKRLKQNNALDFDDLLLYTVRLFQKNPDVLEGYQERWPYICVDEYQDTNHVQYQFTKLLASKYRNLCVIGDSDQSIYRFRGADINNILDFEKDYPEAKIIKLEQNYRSTQTILDAADAIIAKNTRRKEKKMWTEQQGGDLIEVWHTDSEKEEAMEIAKEIQHLQLKGVSFQQIIILYRTNAQSRILEEAFLRYALPYKVVGGVRFYARKEIKDLLAYLRVLLNPNDTESLLRIINVPSRKIGATSLQKLQSFALARSLTLGEVLRHVEMLEELTPRAKSALTGFWRQVQGWRKMAQEKSVSQLIRQIIDEVGYKNYLTDGTEEGEMRYENVLELESVATKYDSLAPGLSLGSFLEEVALVADTDSIRDAQELVTMMTLHSVKGLEYPYVFIVGCEEGIFPSSRAFSDPEELEEERRLMYVGVTRAMKKLYLVAAKRRMLFGNIQSNPLSRFLKDIPDDLLHKKGLASSFGKTDYFSNSPFSFNASKDQLAENRFKDGDRIRHAGYGEGIVIERRGDLMTVAFDNKLFGIRKFAANIAPLEKI